MPLEENAVVARRFRLVSELSRGGMGTVWCARDLVLGVPCAVKFTEGSAVVDAVRRARFEREAKAAARLRSPHVVQILDHGIWEGRPYIAMELLEGEDLAERIGKNRGLSAAETASVVSQIARALTKAHAAGIVHRDLKPGNVFLCRDRGGEGETAKLLDFGIAKAPISGARLDKTKTGALIGTPSYMSPEQAEGVREVDFRSDLWSLGVIAFECMTGRRPVESEALGDMLNRIINKPLPAPSALARVPAGFDGWFARACARAVEDRFQSAQEMADALGVALASTVVETSAAPPTETATATVVDADLRLPPSTFGDGGGARVVGRRAVFIAIAATTVGIASITIAGRAFDADAVADGDRIPAAAPSDPIVDIATGHQTTCVVAASGAVRCWGLNEHGQLGLGDWDDRGDDPGELSALRPIDLGTRGQARAVAVQAKWTCALLRDGRVKCWGRNDTGQLGVGDRQHRGDEAGEMGDALPAVDLGTGRTATALAAGGGHTCALLDDGTVKCWGLNGDGQLGVGDRDSRGDDPDEMGDRLPIADLGTGQKAVAITAGRHHNCALLDDATVRCWGAGGQLGLEIDGTDDRGDEPGEMGDALPTLDLGAGMTPVEIHSSGYHTCALSSAALVKCWGSNDHGQLGLGDRLHRGDEPGEMGDELPFVSLGHGRKVRSVAAGPWHTCTLLEDGAVKCWGGSYHGVLGLGDLERRGDGPHEMGDDLPAVDLGAGDPVVRISVGTYHTCVLRDDHSSKCWGWGGNGALGAGDQVDRGDGPGDMGDHLAVVPLSPVPLAPR